MTINISDDLYEEVKTWAENYRVSISSFAATAIHNYMVLEKKKKFGQRVLKLAGKTQVDQKIFSELAKTRKKNDDRA